MMASSQEVVRTIIWVGDTQALPSHDGLIARGGQDNNQSAMNMMEVQSCGCPIGHLEQWATMPDLQIPPRTLGAGNEYTPSGCSCVRFCMQHRHT